MVNLSKSRYTKLWQCPKMLWLSKYKPEEEPPTDAATQAVFDTGNEVGDLAMGLFGAFVEVTEYKDDGSGDLDLGKMIERTKEEIEKGTEVICEASFTFNGLYCAVDILKKAGAGWAIYEVKSSTHPDKDVYLVDAAYQRYVLEKCGVNVTCTCIVTLNNKYYRDGELDIQKLFNVTDVSDMITDEYKQVEQRVAEAEVMMSSEEEPETDIGPHCMDPYNCAFWNYCTASFPEDNIFDLNGLGAKRVWPYYDDGIVSFNDLIESDCKLTDIQKMQIEHALHPQDAHIDKGGIKTFLDTLSYPLYFLDFETMGPAIPQIDDSRPYDRIVFQYSLHYIEREGGEVLHKEFLGESGTDPRRAAAEALCRDIPRDVCVLAYSKGFECGVLGDLAKIFPDLSEHLLNISEHIVDLKDPFRLGYYYNRAMRGSFSIKSVLPAVFPDDPELDYSNLEGVHNGDEAKNIFPKIKDMNPKEAEKTRNNLLEYCKLDTYAMVKLWQELVQVTK